MTFAVPQWLWCLAVLPLIWVLALVGRKHHTPGRLLGATVLRSAVVVLAVLAAAQPQWAETVRGISAVYALDVSRSVSPEHQAGALAWIRDTNARFQPASARYVVFADRARLVASLDDVAAVPVATADGASAPGAIARGATDLETALRTASFGFEPHLAKRLVLVSDGRETRGDLWRALPRLEAEKVRVFAMPAPAAVQADAWVDAIGVPSGIRQHQPLAVGVAVHALSPMAARVTLASGKRLLGTMSVSLRAGRNDITFDTNLPDAGTATLIATVRAAGDQNAANDTLSVSVTVGPPPRVLYVEGAPESARYLAEALRAHHLDVTVSSAEALAADPGTLGRHDAAILSDVLAASLDAKTLARLETFVREDGGGVLFAAGESTYGQEGFGGSALERLLPVRFEAKRKRRDLDLVLLIDRSHSMRGRKLELAKTAALSTLDLLEPRHRLAVVAFDARPHEVVPLVAVGNKRRAEDLIASMTAKGQTNLFPALQEAQRLLAGSAASTKHIILLSDGVTMQPPATDAGSPTAAEIQALIQKGREDAMRREGIEISRPEAAPPLPPPGAIEMLAGELAKAGVTLSTIAIGDKPNLALMADIATVGKGRAHVARSDAEIPGLFVSETRKLLGESILETPFRPVVAHQVPALAGLDFAKGPVLRGLVIARPKVFSDVLLRGPKDHPLLATTHYGLGKTAAFLSDVKNRWATDWLAWDGYGRLWAQLVRDVMRRPAPDPLTLRVSRDRSDVLVELRAIAPDRTYRNSLAPSVRVLDPAGASSALVLTQTAPGHYAARRPIEAGYTAPYRFELLPGGGLTPADAQAAGVQTLFHPWSDESRALPPDNEMLRALSERTGGVFAASAEDIFAERGDASAVPRELWPVLVSFALALFLADILWRRMPVRR